MNGERNPRTNEMSPPTQSHQHLDCIVSVERLAKRRCSINDDCVCPKDRLAFRDHACNVFHLRDGNRHGVARIDAWRLH
jgi:hypothetical protein